MPQTTDDFRLIDMKNAYFMGAFQNCINEAQKFRNLSPEQENTRDLFMYRAYIAQKKYRVVLDEIPVSAPSQLQPLRLLAEFLASPSKQNEILDKVDAIVSGGFDPNDVGIIVVSAMIYYQVGNFEAALRILRQGDNLECSAMTIQCLLAYDRVDLAQKELKLMQEKDEDAILTQMSTAWVNLYLGGEKYQETFYIAQEMIDKYGSSPLLLNLLAACYIAQGKYSEAESSLQEALDKDPNSADALINFFMNSSFVGKSTEVANRYLSQLKDAHPNHPFVQDYYKKEAEFDRVATLFCAS